MKDVTCPYCGAEFDIEHDDADSYEEDDRHQYDCPKCEKTFVYTVSVTISHEGYIADCLNGAPHKYKKTNHYPRMCSVLRCEDCGDEKPLFLCPDCGHTLDTESVKHETMYCHICAKIPKLSEAKEDT